MNTNSSDSNSILCPVFHRGMIIKANPFNGLWIVTKGGATIFTRQGGTVEEVKAELDRAFPKGV